MGGDKAPTVTAPPVTPSTTETSAQSIQAQIDAIPKILAAQQQYGSQFSQLDLDQMKQFGPQYAEYALGLEKQFGTQLAEQTRAEQAILAPERIAGSNYLTNYLTGAEDLTAQEEMQAKQKMRAGQAERGMAFSGQSAADELKALTEMRQNLKSRKIQTALGVAGQQPAVGGNTVSSPTSFGQQLVQNVTPAQTFGLAASNYATQSNNWQFGNQMNSSNWQADRAYMGDIWGGLLGGAGAIGGGFASKSSIRYKDNVKLWA
jgi:hypothetical protein